MLLYGSLIITINNAIMRKTFQFDIVNNFKNGNEIKSIENTPKPEKA